MSDNGTAVYNPLLEKERPKKKKRVLTTELMRLQNPIPAEIQDSEELSKSFSKFNLVPYAGTTTASGDTLLWWYIALSKLSPTWGTCIQKLGEYAFGTRMKIEYATDPNFDTGEDLREVSSSDSVAYFEVFKQIFQKRKPGLWSDWMQDLHRSRKSTGNVFVELAVTEINGQWSATVHFHPTTNCRYKATKPGEPKVIAVSPRWDEDYLRKNEPTYIPSFPNYTSGKGVQRTMFHLKDGTNEWYGRPESDFTDMSKYQEAQNQMYLIIQAQNQYVGSLIIEGEDGAGPGQAFIDDEGAQQSGHSSFLEQFEEQHTMKGDDPSSFMIFARPMGGRPLFVFQVSPNTNENWFKVMGEEKRGEIMRGEGCTLRFLGFEAANGFSTDAFVDDYVFNMEPVIYNNREAITNFFNQIVSEVWRITGNENLNRYSVTFGSPIEMQLAEYKARANGNQTQTQSIPVQIGNGNS